MANFTAFKKISSNIRETLSEVAKEKRLKLEDIDFDVLSVITLVQSPEYVEWTIIEDPIEKVFDEEALRSNALLIKQEYKIVVRPYLQDVRLQGIKIEIASNKAKSKVVATFKKGSLFSCDPNLAKLLKREINKRKLRLGLLIGHFEDTLNSMILKLIKAVKCDVTLPKDIRITIAKSPGAEFPIDDSIILHYENLNEQSSMIDGVDPDVLVFEYIKPKKGLNGRACTGSFITVPEPENKYSKYKPDIKTIKIQDDEKSVKYYSIIDGYVKNVSSVISISQEISISSASFRDTGSIETGDNKDISVNINNKNSSDDAVGSGVNIDVKELNVEGTIGSNVKIKANDLKIGEQTHRNSKLEAVENAKVHLHRGKLKAKTAEIEILENGTVQADDVYVKKMLGGEIIGHRVVVEELTSNTVVIASESIEIHSITGDHNKLIINPDKIETYHEKVEEFKENIKEKNAELKEIKDKHDEKLSQHHEQLDRVKTFQKRVVSATKAGKTPVKADLMRVKLYKEEAVRLTEESKYIKTLENQLTETSYELEKLYEAELHAKIINKSVYDGRTQVVFVDVKTLKEYSMSPSGEYAELFLVADGDEKKISW